MKKLSLVLFSVLLLFSFAACDNDKNSFNQDKVSSLKQEQKYFNLGEAAELNKLRFTAVNYEESNGDESHKPKDNNVFVGIEFLVENISQDELAVYSEVMFECYIDDFKSQESDDARSVFDGELLVGTIAKGKKIKGCYAVEAPKDWSVIEIHTTNYLHNSEQEKIIFKIEK